MYCSLVLVVVVFRLVNVILGCMMVIWLVVLILRILFIWLNEISSLFLIGCVVFDKLYLDLWVVIGILFLEVVFSSWVIFLGVVGLVV